MSLPMRAPAASIAATRKRWALDYLAHAAAEHRKARQALEHFETKAREHGCGDSEIAEILSVYR